LLALYTGQATAAMYLDPHGQGQVLLYPYYTVNAGQSSLISVVNTTARGKYVAVFFREGALGEITMDFSLYLAPHDTWTGAVFSLDSQDVANVLATDTTCTNPDVRGASLPRLGDGRPYVPFSAASFLPQPPTPGQALRTREGYVQMIEVGELDVTTSGWASERRCAELRATVGTVPPVPALSTPGGGLYGSLAIVNVSAGTYFATQATAIGGFADHVLLKNTADSPFTDLKLGVHDAQVSLGNRLITVTYASAIDAVSGLLMSEALWGDFVTEPAAGATTEWVLTQPTKQYYNAAPLPLPPPYASVTRPSPSMACQPYAAEIYDREQRVIFPLNELDPPPVGASSLCYSTDVLRFGSPTGASCSPFTMATARSSCASRRQNKKRSPA
jgi:hypothetical protein